MNKVSCFIRKNTEELREKLREMGLNIWHSHSNTDKVFLFVLEAGNAYDVTVYCVDELPPIDLIDCGENEEQFLALAACNLPTDKHKMFIGYNCMDDRHIVFASKDKLMVGDTKVGYYYHLSTPEEIIEHFKTK